MRYFLLKPRQTLGEKRDQGNRRGSVKPPVSVNWHVNNLRRTTTDRHLGYPFKRSEIETKTPKNTRMFEHFVIGTSSRSVYLSRTAP